jgi:hypothetical protein
MPALASDDISPFTDRELGFQIYHIRFINEKGETDECVVPTYFREINDSIKEYISNIFKSRIYGNILELNLIAFGDYANQFENFPSIVQDRSIRYYTYLKRISRFHEGGFFFGVTKKNVTSIQKYFVVLESRERLLSDNSADFSSAVARNATVKCAYIYIFSQNILPNFVKIGFSSSPERRIAEVRKRFLGVLVHEKLVEFRVKTWRKHNRMTEQSEEQAIKFSHSTKIDKNLKFKLLYKRKVMRPYFVEQEIHDRLCHLMDDSDSLGIEWFSLDVSDAAMIVDKIIDSIEKENEMML